MKTNLLLLFCTFLICFSSCTKSNYESIRSPKLNVTTIQDTYRVGVPFNATLLVETSHTENLSISVTVVTGAATICCNGSDIPVDGQWIPISGLNEVLTINPVMAGDLSIRFQARINNEFTNTYTLPLSVVGPPVIGIKTNQTEFMEGHKFLASVYALPPHAGDLYMSVTLVKGAATVMCNGNLLPLDGQWVSVSNLNADLQITPTQAGNCILRFQMKNSFGESNVAELPFVAVARAASVTITYPKTPSMLWAQIDIKVEQVGYTQPFQFKYTIDRNYLKDIIDNKIPTDTWLDFELVNSGTSTSTQSLYYKFIGTAKIKIEIMSGSFHYAEEFEVTAKGIF